MIGQETQRPVRIESVMLRANACSVLLACALTVGCSSFYGSAYDPGPPLGAQAPATVLPGTPLMAVQSPPPSTIALPPGALPPPGPPPQAAPSTTVSPLFGPRDNAQLGIFPRTIVAPVGSEVVMLATLADGRGRPMANQRIEWMLSPNSTGQFITLGQRDQCLALRWPKNKPRKVDNNFAIGSTSLSSTTLTRGTPTQVDDISVSRGQAWISVSSPTAGTSHITAFAPQVLAWDRRTRAATIYWVDAQFSLPAPSIAQSGARQVLGTNVTRSSDGSPIEGFLVRYEIVDGPAAGFAPNGATMVEVPTDGEGRAMAEIFQSEPARGANTIAIEVIRPARFAGRSERRLPIGRGSTTVTWTSPEITVRMTGPAQAEVGATATYRIDVTNTGDSPVSDVTITTAVPKQLTYRNSSIGGEVTPGAVTWNVASLGPSETHSIQVDFEVVRAGSIRLCASVKTGEGLSAEDCLSTTADLAQLELHLSGPETATVGQSITYAVTITNRTATAIENLVIRDEYDDGLEHAAGTNPIQREIGSIGAGETRDDIAVTFRTVRAGRACHTVEISAEGIRPTRAQACVVVGPAARDPQPGLSVSKSAPPTARVGEKLLFDVLVTNTGDTTLRNVTITDSYEEGLKPTRVSEGYKIEDEQITWRYDTLVPGEARRLQVEAECQRAVRACSRVTVTADGDLIMADETCVQIAAKPEAPRAGPPAEPPAPGPSARPATGNALSIAITDLRDEVPVGGTVVYAITIRNLRDVSDGNVQVIVTVPEGMTPLRNGIKGPSQPVIAGRIVRFSPVAEWRAGEDLTYHVPVRADRAGRFAVQATVTSRAQQEPLSATEDSNIFEKP